MISNDNSIYKIPEVLSVVPTMDIVVFPNQIVPLLVLDDRIINGINKSLEEEPKLILLLASKKGLNGQNSAISMNDLYSVGTVANIMRIVKIQEGGLKILVQGISKAKVNKFIAENHILSAQVEPIIFENNCTESEIKSQIKNIREIADEISSTGYIFSPDFFIILSKMDNPDKISDFILSHLHLNVEQAQELLESKNQKEFLDKLYSKLIEELELSEVQENIKNRAKDSMNKSQKEFYLREQLKAIKKELGEDDIDDIERIREKLLSMNLPEDVKLEANRQINRLEKTSPDSMEAAVIRNHLDWIVSLPWSTYTKDNLDLKRAKNILEQDHYGLKDIKERILDYISIKHLKSDDSAPILCFSGPPGTGKTSLGKSIANSLERKYFRVSLGGVKDEAEIRGHRRTYVGAMPGRFIQGIKKAGSCNPVIIIDELDKIGADFRGDPSAAMLEILDPQQNQLFYDNYLGIPFDLSKVIFIATANNIDTISEPLKDRMEIITIPGYSFEEKLQIAKKYLIKRSVESTGLENYDLKFSDDIISEIILNYTRESGVRELERLIKKLCSKTARNLIENSKIIKFNLSNLENYLGPKKFIDNDYYNQDHIGISNGLAWTAYGGELIKVEAILIPGDGKLILTGSLGKVLQESAQAALSYAKAHSNDFNIDKNKFKNYDLHIHVPGGGVPKDGPSAGITLLSSILSALTERPISAEYAMTGELNLRGNIMPIGGVKEKILAAKRNKVLHVILPDQNRNDLIGSENIAEGIDVIWVKHANEVIDKVLIAKN